jgi:hypothetical protein
MTLRGRCRLTRPWVLVAKIGLAAAPLGGVRPTIVRSDCSMFAMTETLHSASDCSSSRLPPLLAARSRRHGCRGRERLTINRAAGGNL